MLSFARSIIDGICSLVFPPCCSICDESVSSSYEIICSSCRDGFVRVSGNICETCGRPLSDAQEKGAVCGRCITEPPPFEMARYGFFHVGNLRRALIDFKYFGRLHHGQGLALLLNETFQQAFSKKDIDLIIPMPMHPRRLIKRGFNQVVLLGDRLARATGIPMKRDTLRKIKDTMPQVGLTRTQRLTNVAGSFGVLSPEEVCDRSLLLLDDVSTTGSTIKEATHVLKRAGASSVAVLVLALRIPEVVNERTRKGVANGIDDAGGF